MFRILFLNSLVLSACAGEVPSSTNDEPSDGEPLETYRPDRFDGLDFSVRDPEITAPRQLRVSERHFDTLVNLVAASDLVAVGRVIAVRPGRIVGQHVEDALQMKELTLVVEDGMGVSGTTIVIEEPGWQNDSAIGIEDAPIARAGDRIMLFGVHKRDRESVVRAVSTQGIHLLDGERVIASGREDALVRAIESMTIADLVAVAKQPIAAQ